MKKLVILMLFAVVAGVSYAQSGIERTWYNQEKSSKIQIYKATDGLYYGKIVWLKDENDSKGNPRTDVNNSNEKLRQTPMMNLLILKKFKNTGENTFEDGTVYDPVSGKTYCGKLTLQGNQIKLKGFICGMSLLGRTSTWTLAE